MSRYFSRRFVKAEQNPIWATWLLGLGRRGLAPKSPLVDVSGLLEMAPGRLEGVGGLEFRVRGLGGLANRLPRRPFAKNSNIYTVRMQPLSGRRRRSSFVGNVNLCGGVGGVVVCGGGGG